MNDRLGRGAAGAGVVGERVPGLFDATRDEPYYDNPGQGNLPPAATGENARGGDGLGGGEVLRSGVAENALDSISGARLIGAPQAVRVIGIDPGLSGALAVLERGMLLAVLDLPVMVKGKGTGKVKNEVNAAELARILREWIGVRPEMVCFAVEQVNAMPPVDGKRSMGSSGLMSMGDTSGCIRGVIAALGCAITWIAPATWKAHFKLRGGEDQKEAARAHAIRLFPACPDLARKKDHNRAEAVLLARYYLERYGSVLPERPF